ncbi:MAG: ribonuclease Z [Lachnospiraceae bacterium]|nr:ribonuclease Z [Lachnospiraceae bacterium]
MLDVCLLGTGGMMPLPYRRLTALMLRLNGKSLLIDCGEGTQVGIRAKGWSFHDIDVICLTHYHADHVSGLPGLLLSIGNSERTEPVTIIGPKGLERVVRALRTIAPELPFEIELIEIEGNSQTFELAGYRIDTFKVDHNVICYGYSISIDRQGKFDPEKAAANEVPMKLWSRLQKGAELDFEGRHFTPDMILGEQRKGLKVTYCTDSRPVKVIAEAAEGADLFICEGMYNEPGSEERAKEHKHMCYAEAAKLAAQAQPKEMWLTHYSPALAKPEEFIDEVRKIFANTIAAKDLRSTTLKFEDEVNV